MARTKGSFSRPGKAYRRAAIIGLRDHCARPLLSQVVGVRQNRLGASLPLLVVVAITGCGGGAVSHDYSKAISRHILVDGTQQVRHVTNHVGESGRTIINNARCVQSAGTERYSCVVHYTYQNSEGTYRYEVNVSATCPSSGKCRWHVDGVGTLVGAEPD